MPEQLECPLCGKEMVMDGEHLQCKGSKRHRVHYKKEWLPYVQGQKDMKWLRWRVKVRVGKIIQAGG